MKTNVVGTNNNHNINMIRLGTKKKQVLMGETCKLQDLSKSLIQTGVYTLSAINNLPSKILEMKQPGTEHTWLLSYDSVYSRNTTLCYQTGLGFHQGLAFSEIKNHSN